MAVDFTEGFEGGTNGNNVAGTSAFSGGAVGAGTVIYDNTTPAHGSLAAKFTNSANTISLVSNVTATNVRTMRRYWNVSALPASGNFLILQTARLATVAKLTLRLDSTGKLNIRDVNTNVAATTNAIATGQYFRYEWRLNGATNTQTLDFFFGSNVDGVTPDETISGTYTGTNTFDNIQNGILSTSQNIVLFLDDALDDTAAVTIGSAAPPTTGSPFVFTHTVTIG